MFLLRISAPLMALAWFLLLPSGATALGYWLCESGAWRAIGEPGYESPTRICGEKPVPPTNEAQCLERGGSWKPAGIFPAPICRMPTADAGHVCGDDNECESFCLADLTDKQRDLIRQGNRLRTLGRCAPVSPVFGCLAIVRQAEVRGLLCLD